MDPAHWRIHHAPVVHNRAVDKLTALTVFRRVSELQSFNRAAKDLRLSNTAVSKNVRELEEELGVRLINRTTRRLQLTAAGHEYYDRVVEVLSRLAAADDAASERGTAPRGLLRVSAPMSLGVTLIAPAVATFADRYPEVQIEMELNDRYVNLLEDGFDLALRGGARLQDSSMVARKLVDIERVLCASPAYLAAAGTPKHPDDIGSHRCVIYSLAQSPRSWTLSRGRTRRTIAINSPLQFNNSLAIVRAVEAGAGLALVPRCTAVSELARGTLRPVLESWRSEVQALHAVYPQHRQSVLRLRLFLDHLVAALRPRP